MIFTKSATRRTYDVEVAATFGDLADLLGQALSRLARAKTLTAAVAALERRQEALSAFADATPLSIIMTDRDARVLKAVGQWLVNRRLAESRVLGGSVYDIDRGDRTLSEAFDRVISTGQSSTDIRFNGGATASFTRCSRPSGPGSIAAAAAARRVVCTSPLMTSPPWSRPWTAPADRRRA